MDQTSILAKHGESPTLRVLNFNTQRKTIMGYYTYYTLEVDDFEMIHQLREQNEVARYAFDDNGDLLNQVKWYNSEEDLKEFSKQYPETLFKLRGEGEEPGDLWICYIKNGKSQLCQARIEYDEFDENKLT